jgi:peptidoglycan/xylan/chitin deacetylase (PgdA/CDA1 family)
LGERFHVVDLPEVLASDDEPRLAVTFDDGYRNFFTEALPVLESLGVPTTLFVVTELVGADRRDPRDVGLSAGPDEMLTDEQMRELADHDLVTLGNHTATHPSLPDLDDERLHREIVDARQSLARRYGVDVTRFCYPGGKYDRRVRQVVGRTHDVGVGVSRGFVEPPVSQWKTTALPRINAARATSVVRWETSGLGESLRQRYRRLRG